MSLNIRLEQVVKYSGKNVTAFGEEFESVGAENIRKLIKNPKANPSYNFLVELFQKYPNINVNWFLFGNGNMTSENNRESNNHVNDHAPGYFNAKEICADKDKLIALQEKYIAELEQQLGKKETLPKTGTQ